MIRRSIVSLLPWVVLAGCVTTVPPPPASPRVLLPEISHPSAFQSELLIRVSTDSFPLISDDLDAASLKEAVGQSLCYFRSLSPDQTYTLGVDTYTVSDLADSLESFTKLLDENLSPADFLARLKGEYVLYHSIGSDGTGAVTFSSYYEPTIPASLQKTGAYRFPIYARPADLVDVNLGRFNPTSQGARLEGRRHGKDLVPYYTRADIDSKGMLTHKGLELAWARNPVDIFFMQVEGTGWLDLGQGRTVRIRYDGDNGRKYTSVGLYMIQSGRVSASGFGHNQFKEYMDKHPESRQDLLNVDERYVFFRIDTSTASPYAYGNIDVPLTPGRSIATDPKIFPKGLLAWVSIQTTPHPASGHPLPQGEGLGVRRFMLNQDEGGAIQGPGRVDVFAGHGPAAEEFATHLWNPGELYFLVKKK